jgi:hypothetical protein
LPGARLARALRQFAASRITEAQRPTAGPFPGAAFPYVISLTELAGANPHHCDSLMFNPMKEDTQ